MVIKLTRKTMVTNIISQLVNAVVKLSVIVKIHTYRKLHEGHHFIPMAMEIHDASRRDVDYFIMECVHLFHNRRSRGHLFLFFCIQFFRRCVNIVLQCALAFTIERKIALTGNACSRLLLQLDLKVCMWMTLKGRWVRFLPTRRGTSSLPSLVPARLHIFWPFFGLPFCFVCVMVLAIGFYWFFCPFTNTIL